MDYSQGLLDDFELRDDLQLVSITNAVTGVVVSSVKARNRNLNYREATLGGSLGYEPTDQVFALGCKSLLGAGVNRGDTITTTDGTKWTVLSDVLSSFGDTAVYLEVVSRKQV